MKCLKKVQNPFPKNRLKRFWGNDSVVILRSFLCTTVAEGNSSLIVLNVDIYHFLSYP